MNVNLKFVITGSILFTYAIFLGAGVGALALVLIGALIGAYLGIKHGVEPENESKFLTGASFVLVVGVVSVYICSVCSAVVVAFCTALVGGAAIATRLSGKTKLSKFA